MPYYYNFYEVLEKMKKIEICVGKNGYLSNQKYRNGE